MTVPTDTSSNFLIDHFSKDDIDRMAAAIHNVWKKMKEVENQQKQYVPSSSSVELLNFDQLSEDLKEQNRSSARNILNQVQTIGMGVVQKKSKKAQALISDEQIELLAQLEHQRWVTTHLQNGWEYSEQTEKDKKKHSDLVPWDLEELNNIENIYGENSKRKLGKELLSEKSRQYDRDIVKAYPLILDQAGFKIISTRK